MTTIDFNRALQDAKGATFEALPIGDYDVEVAKAEAVTSSTGKPMIKTTMRVVTGPYERRPIVNQFVMTLDNPQATAIFFRHMRAFGLDEQFFASLGSASSLEPVASALVGRRARLSIGHREWQGEVRNEVKSVKPYTGAPPMAPPPGPIAPGAPASPAPLTHLAGPVAGPTPPSASVPVPPAAPALPQVQPMPQPPTASEPPAAGPATAPPTLPV